MILFTSNLKPFSKIFNLVKISGNAYYDHVFLDFRKKKMSFYTDTTSVRIDLVIEGDKDVDYLYVDGLKFFFLVNTYSSLTIKKGKFYSEKGDKFSLPLLEEDLAFSLEEDYDLDVKTIKFTEDVLSDLEICKEFLDKDQSFPAVFFEQDNFIALSQMKYIQAPSGLPSTTSFSIPVAVIRVLLSLGIAKDTEIDFRMKSTPNGGQIIEFNYKDLFYKFSSSSDISLPTDPYAEDFTSSFEHEEFFRVKTKEFLEAVKVLSSFSNSDISHCRIDFENEKSIKIKLLSDSEIDYSLTVEDYSDSEYFIEKSFWISLFGLSSAVNSFSKKKVDEIQIHYSSDAPAIKMLDATDSKKIFIVQTLIEEPNL
jgi:hypothetical protein